MNRRAFFSGAVGAFLLSILPFNRARSKEVERRKKNLSDLKNCTDIQCSHGNWNYDPYMHGMANGLILAMCIMGDCKEEPKYKDAPEQWLCDIPDDGKPPIPVLSEPSRG
jgi:hypothetical protein